MQKYRLITWCNEATWLIRFGPDRRAVSDELYAHLEDRRDAYMAQGMDEKEATDKALDAMGSAADIAPQLAAIHRPFWGYFLRACRILLVILLVFSLKPIWDYTTELYLRDKPDRYHDFDVYDPSSYGGDTGRSLKLLSQPDISFHTDGSTFTLTDAAVYTRYSDYYGREQTSLYVLIRQTSPLPFTEHEAYFPRHTSEISVWFSARDSLGNTYAGWKDFRATGDHLLFSEGVQSGIFTYTHECWIGDLPSDAQWVEIIYERDGRSYSMYVDLTGGSGV